MNKTISKLKLNYLVAQGSFSTLETERQQLKRLSEYVLNIALSQN